MEFQNRPRAARRHAAALASAAVLGAGCASPAYDPAPPADVPQHVVRFQAPVGVEASYRTLFERLSECAGRDGYRVQPRFDRDAGRAWIMLVTGLGLDRYSVLGNRFEARFEARESPGGTLVEVSYADPGLAVLAEASRGWLLRGTRSCRP